MPNKSKIHLLALIDDHLTEAISSANASQLNLWYTCLLPVAVDCGAVWAPTGLDDEAFAHFYIVEGQLMPVDYQEWIRELRDQVWNASTQQTERYARWARSIMQM